MILFETVIKGSGNLEKDVIKVTFQFMEILLYIATLHYLFLL